MPEDIERKKKEIQDEIDKLNHEFKVELPLKINEAREHGDLKENADYHAARERQGFVRARIAHLSDQIAKLNSIDESAISKNSVGFGSVVKLQDTASDYSLTLTFVTEDQVNPSEGKITLMTPYGRAVTGKMVGDIAEVTLPAGLKRFRIVYIKTIHGNEIFE